MPFLFYIITKLMPLVSSSGAIHARTIVSRRKVAVLRSSIRGFRDDYHDVDADVVVLTGVIHDYINLPVSSYTVPVW